MKERITQICILILTWLLAVIAIGCGGMSTVKNKDDDISKAIYEAVGSEKVYYKSKAYIASGEAVMYSYVVNDYEDESLLTDITGAVNAVIKEKEMTYKIHLVIQEKKSRGTEMVACVNNYYSDEQYESLQCLYIYGTKHSNKGDASPYNKAATYINLPDIKRLVVTEKIAQSAEDEKIDWYDIWPDLEYYEVLKD